MSQRTTILPHLIALYGDSDGRQTFERLRTLLAQYRLHLPPPHPRHLSQLDAVLITYGDIVRQPGAAPLATLARFLHAHIAGLISTVHLLPFYPYSSDDGFSVIDYKTVDPALGSWQEVAQIGRHFRLMFDLVANHVSARSRWFQAFLRDEAKYRDYFTVVEPGTDLSQVFRPRALPLLTEVVTAAGPKQVWTTFSDDQIDLNYRNPDVLLDVVDTLLFYVARGASVIRLDAIAFIWKEIGTSCIHLPQTHRLIQLLRAVLDVVAPQVVIITETNVPHADNISYFGDGSNEAQLVYNFSLPPLTLHALHSGSAETLSHWASSLTLPSDEVTFFNFLASHDGIGLMPARGILSEAAVSAMASRVEALGGYVSYKNNSDGTQSAYELNINYLEALGDPEAVAGAALAARRFLLSQAIMLALQGVPGIYFHSLFGSQNWREGVIESGRYRSINREKLQRRQLEQELADPTHLRHHVFAGYRTLLQQRASHAAFHPHGHQRVLFYDEAVFSLLRSSPDGRSQLLCLHNVADQPCRLSLDLETLNWPRAVSLTDCLTGVTYSAGSGRVSVSLAPYQALWLEAPE